MIKSATVWPLKKPSASSSPDFPDLVLTGPRVFLRPPRSGDAALWLALRRDSRDHLIPFEPEWGDDHLSIEFFDRRRAAQLRDWTIGLSRSFLIFDHATAALVGGMNINTIARGAAQFGSLGYWLGQPYQGRGYMTEAAHLTAQYAFGPLALERLSAATLPHNHRSMAMLKRIGFIEEGFAKAYLQINGQRQDHVLFGLPKSSYTSPDCLCPASTGR